MFLLSKADRRARRARLYRQRVLRLSQVTTTPGHSPDGLVVTVLMTGKPDPQRGQPIEIDYLDYIRPWWTTLNKVGLSGIILHDGLPSSLIERATTSWVKFQRITPGPWPILHDRHRLVLEYLTACPAEYVLITDVSDVAFKRDPFPLLRTDHVAQRLCVGSEASLIGRSRCLRNEMQLQFGQLLHADRQVVNPGILGGRRRDVLPLLQRIVDCIAQHEDRLVNSDMSLINHVIHSHYRWQEILTGYPLHSRFKKWEYDTSACILHK